MVQHSDTVSFLLEGRTGANFMSRKPTAQNYWPLGALFQVYQSCFQLFQTIIPL